jgi:hypothetical protein
MFMYSGVGVVSDLDSGVNLGLGESGAGAGAGFGENGIGNGVDDSVSWVCLT